MIYRPLFAQLTLFDCQHEKQLWSFLMTRGHCTLCGASLGPVHVERGWMATPIASLEEARAFLRLLHTTGLSFHPEDDPGNVIDRQGNEVFSLDECTLLRQRVKEIYQFDSDPSAYCLSLHTYSLDHYERTNNQT